MNPPTDLTTSAPAWLDERRRRGASLAQELPLPDRKAKGWEFTDLSGLDLTAYEEASAEPVLSGAEGAIVVSLAEALSSHSDLLRERLGSLVPAEDFFVARNEAGWGGGGPVFRAKGRGGGGAHGRPLLRAEGGGGEGADPDRAAGRHRRQRDRLADAGRARGGCR